MHKDANLRKRNALTIPGGLLAFYGLVGVLYVALLRTDEGTCGDASLIVFAGACRSAALVMAIPVILGLALAAVGAIAFRGKATCRHGHGSWTHFTLALLVSLVVVPILGIVLAPSLVGSDAAVVVNGVRYFVTSLFGGVAALGILMLIPFGVLYAGQVRANPCCGEKGCFAPCFCDEVAPEEAPGEPAPAEAAAAATPAAPAEEQAKDDWEVVEAPSAPAPEPAPADPMPGEPTEPAPEPSRSSDWGGPPPLAAHPSDPAAPPSDEMAAAAQWAQEDAEEEAEEGMDEGGEGEDAAGEEKKPARRSRRPAAKTAAKSAKKQAAKPKKR